MCGRYGRRGDQQKIAEVFHIKGSLEEVDFEETFDAPPASEQPVVVRKVWRCCQDSVDYCFGIVSGDTTADSILNMLGSMPEGASLTQISARFNRNKTTEELQRALATLKTCGKARSETRKAHWQGQGGRDRVCLLVGRPLS